MLPDLCSLVNRHWDDKGDAGTMARIIQMLYDGYQDPNYGHWKSGVFTTVDREIQKMITESKNDMKKGKHLLASREKMKKMFNEIDVGEQDLGGN